MRNTWYVQRGCTDGRCMFAAALLAALLLAGCGKTEQPAAAAGGVEAATARSNQQFAQTLDLADQQDFEDAARGLTFTVRGARRSCARPSRRCC